MSETPSYTPTGSIEGPRSDVPLAPLTTLELGGPARHLVEVADPRDAVEAVHWARRDLEPLAVLGGGSNLVVADAGFPGMVLRVAFRGIDIDRDGDAVLVTAGAGETWDDVVAETVARGLAGLECLSGIPGLVGATPIQNVGAYGQEVGDVVEAVRVLDLESLEEDSFSQETCRFSYRSSVFRDRPGRYLVLAVTYRLEAGGPPTLRYEELRRAMAVRESSPRLAGVREAVLNLRRSKSMLLDPGDPNRRSAGSFFLNPVVDRDVLTDVNRRGREAGVLTADGCAPAFEIGDACFKIPAGWLIERSGFSKGLRRGPVGISSAHALGLVHHGGGTAAELVALAREIRDGVQRTFGIRGLRPETAPRGFRLRGRRPLRDAARQRGHPDSLGIGARECPL